MEYQLKPLLAESDRVIRVLNESFTIGRADECNLRVADCGVSRHHCELFVRDGMLYVRDLHSSNGTWVNDERVEDELPLRDGDVLSMSATAYRVDLKPRERERDGLWNRVMHFFHCDRSDAGTGFRNSTGGSKQRSDRFDPDPVQEAGIESYPASDPPAWTSVRT